MNYGLPKSVEVNGVEYKIRSDYRPILDICSAMNDPDLEPEDIVIIAMNIFYEDCDSIPLEDWKEAVEKCFAFINMDEDQGPKRPKLVDWEQDFNYIIAPINRVAGTEVRALDYLHWWTFISYYYEIGGDCTFAQIVSIRDKLARGKKLDKQDREWLRNNAHLVHFKNKYSAAEKETLKQWGLGNGGQREDTQH